MEDQIWKSIREYEGYYEISNLGTVRGLDRKIPIPGGSRHLNSRIITQRVGNRGYPCVRLSRDGNKSYLTVHRLIATAFIPNLDEKREVNHKNGNKADNRVDNLEWCTHSENMQHADKTGLWSLPEKRRRKVKDICTGRTFNSIRESAEFNSMNPTTLRYKLSGRRKNNTCLRLAA